MFSHFIIYHFRLHQLVLYLFSSRLLAFESKCGVSRSVVTTLMTVDC